MSLRALAAVVHHGKSFLHELETGARTPLPEVARRLDAALGAGGTLSSLAVVSTTVQDCEDSGLDAIELARRVAASDVGDETMERLEAHVDVLAMAYATIPPAELLPRVAKNLRYVSRLVEARKTLRQHRRLLVVGGWLALLRATLHVDLAQPAAASAHLATATSLAEHAENSEIAAWCLETQAWTALTAGENRSAVDLSRQAQQVAPRGGSAIIQATAQEGRAWARLGDGPQTRDALTRVSRLVAGMAKPDHPEHHYHYDPTKAMTYAATTLAWVGDPAAEEFARHVVAELDGNGDGVARPRRAASARLDLGLALVSTGKADEAAAVTAAAIESGRVVPSNWWRATEIVEAVERCGPSEARDLRDLHEAYRPRE